MITDPTIIETILETKTLLVFDFDGVIADSISVKTEAYRALYKPYGKLITEKVVEHHRANGGMSRYEKFEHYHKFFLDIDIAQESMDQLCKDFSKLVVKKVIAAREIEGIGQFLEKLFLSNKTCVINSATPTEEIVEIVNKRNLSKYFAEIYGSPTSKQENLKSAMHKYNLQPNDLLFFGDDKADLIAADNLNIQFTGVGKGMYEILINSKNDSCYLENFRSIYQNK